MAKRTILFIHGLWIHSIAWQPWMDFFNQQGYKTRIITSLSQPPIVIGHSFGGLLAQVILGGGIAAATIPAPARPHFQAAIATFAGSETKVNTANATRGPLLITGGEKDHIALPVLGKASLQKYNSSVITEFKLFEGRGHSLVADHGWREVAEYGSLPRRHKVTKKFITHHVEQKINCYDLFACYFSNTLASMGK